MKTNTLLSKISIICFFASTVLLTGSQLAFANNELIRLETDKPVYVNGETVRLAWYINTQVQNCIITGPNLTIPVEPAIITNDVLAGGPVQGTYSYVPPDDSASAFNLACERYTPTVVNVVTPVTTVAIDWNTSWSRVKYFDDELGGVPSTIISWSSRNATRCRDVIYRSASTGNVWTTVPIEDDADYSNRGGTSGWVRFDGDPRALIAETTEFAVGCFNDNQDPPTSHWNTKRLEVNVVPPELPPIRTSLTTTLNPPRAVADPVFGYAQAPVTWGATYADRCRGYASHIDGTPITVSGWNFGYTQWGHGGTSRTAQLATTTVFTLECVRDARVYGSVVYPATSTSRHLTIEVVNPNGDPMDEWDRSDPLVVPPVTITASAMPNPTYRDPLIGRAATAVSVDAQNSSYCYLRAYRDDDGDGIYTNLYSLDTWTRTGVSNRLPQNYTGTIYVSQLTVSSRLEIQCLRDYDLNTYGSLEDMLNGIAVDNIIIEVLLPDDPTPDPVVYLYSNAVGVSTEAMWTNKISHNGYLGVTGSPLKSYLYGAAGAGQVNRVSFPFSHPYEGFNAYDVWLNYCDNIVPDDRIGIAITADDINHVYFNDSYLGFSTSWTTLSYYTPKLRPGLNVISVKATNGLGAAGMLAAMRWAGGTIVSDESWKVSTVEESGWNSVAFDDTAWSNSLSYGVYGSSVWGSRVAGFLGGTGAEWIWSPDGMIENTTVYLRYSFYVDPASLVGGGNPRIYRFYDGDNELRGSYEMSGVLAPASCAVLQHPRVRIASSVLLTHDDVLTIECQNGVEGDNCPTNRVFFGAGNGTNVVASMDPVTERANLQMLWFSENTTTCSNFARRDPITNAYWGTWHTGSGVSGFLAYSVATSTKFTASCTRPFDNRSATSEVTVNVPFRSIYNISTEFSTGECIDDGTFSNPGQQMTAPPGWGPDLDPDSPQFGICIPLIDLGAGQTGWATTSATVVNNIAGTYYNSLARLVILNTGLGDLADNSNISYMVQMFTRTLEKPVSGVPDVVTSIERFNGGLSAAVDELTPTESPMIQQSFTSEVTFGRHLLCSRVNLDGSPNFPEVDSNEVDRNNENCVPVSVAVPEPPMTLVADKYFVRKGQSAVITYGVNVIYDMQCTMRGAGIESDNFNPMSEGSLTGSGYRRTVTASLTNTGLFQLECTEPITNTTFNREIRVEVVPDYIEI